MKYDGVVIISDLDGTLLDEDRRLSAENQGAISEFMNNGGFFGVATGRTETTLLKNFPDIPLNIPSIFYNGALICDIREGRILKDMVMHSSVCSFLKDFLAKYPRMGVEVSSNGVPYIIRSNEIIDFQLEREGLQGVEASWEDIPDGWHKVILAADNPLLKKIKAELESYGIEDVDFVSSESTLIDVIPKGVSKGAAVNHLKDINQNTWKKVITIGDNENDISMLKSADIGIAVGNACQPVIDIADYVIKANSSPCIPQVIKIIEDLYK